MVEESSVSQAVVARPTWLPRANGAMFEWDGSSGVCREVGLHPVSEDRQQSTFQAKGQPATAHRAHPYRTTGEICLVPASPQRAIAWEKEAARVIFALDPVLLSDTDHGVAPRVTGELVWVHWQAPPMSPSYTVHPAMLVHALSASVLGERVIIVPALHVHDPLLHHIALVLQAAVEAEGEAGQLYAEALAEALAVHFLRRYATSQPAQRAVSGGLVPYKLQRTLAYIHAHLEQALSLPTLAAVTQMSPTHFAHLFKHATGLAPHQYVSRCRIERAKRLLADTDLPLIEIGPQVGCTDQSHFTALFRRHVAMTPKTYRNTTKRA
jgi:AraC-like DNA-binding protein